MSHAVFLPEIDDEHKEIFEAVSQLQEALANSAPLPETQSLTRRVLDRGGQHFAHEERLMRAARYSSMAWHKRQHDTARKRMKRLAREIDDGDRDAALELVEYLTSWLPQHTSLSDCMLASFLRNQRRPLFKLTFRAGTKPAKGCDWTDSRGDRFDPLE